MCSCCCCCCHLEVKHAIVVGLKDTLHTHFTRFVYRRNKLEVSCLVDWFCAPMYCGQILWQGRTREKLVSVKKIFKILVRILSVKPFLLFLFFLISNVVLAVWVERRARALEVDGKKKKNPFPKKTENKKVSSIFFIHRLMGSILPPTHQQRKKEEKRKPQNEGGVLMPLPLNHRSSTFFPATSSSFGGSLVHHYTSSAKTSKRLLFQNRKSIREYFYIHIHHHNHSLRVPLYL